MVSHKRWDNEISMFLLVLHFKIKVSFVGWLHFVSVIKNFISQTTFIQTFFFGLLHLWLFERWLDFFLSSLEVKLWLNDFKHLLKTHAWLSNFKLLSFLPSKRMSLRPQIDVKIIYAFYIKYAFKVCWKCLY